jgi:hypothetical protein
MNNPNNRRISKSQNPHPPQPISVELGNTHQKTRENQKNADVYRVAPPN